MIRDWFETSEVVAFGREIARDIEQVFPSKPMDQRAGQDKKGQRKLDSVVRRTRAFAQEHKLNVYKKAKLLNTIKWELREAGCDASVINEMISLLTPLLAQR